MDPHPVDARQTEAAASEGRDYDAVVFGATPAGIVAAIRMAREGSSVLLVSVFEHIGGMLANGLSMMDATYPGWRAPLYAEFLDRVYEEYQREDGPGSTRAPGVLWSDPPNFLTRPRFESYIAARVLEDWVAAEHHIELLRRRQVGDVHLSGSLIESVRFGTLDETDSTWASARTYLDCSYEGDLLAAAGVAFAVGREARDAFGEQHAGQIYVSQKQISDGDAPAALESLVLPFGNLVQIIEPETTGRADDAIQAYNMRLVLSADPEASRPVERPTTYDPAFFRSLLAERGARALAVDAVELMNSKVNGPGFGDFAGRSHRYPAAGWAEREAIISEHVSYALGLLYFLQHDEAVPDDVREQSRSYGLAVDEFADNGNVPYEIYARETRRMKGRHIFTEHDAAAAAGIDRSPIHTDSIAFSEWFMDSHACTDDVDEHGNQDGFMLLTHDSRPSQIPLRSLLPNELDNLLVPVCLSATHVGIGNIRVEPVLMHLAESAAWVAVLAGRVGTTVAAVPAGEVQTALLANHIAIAFFDDIHLDPSDDRSAAAQYLSTRGFFPGYRADLDRPLAAHDAVVWADLTRQDEITEARARTAARQLHSAAAGTWASPLDDSGSTGTSAKSEPGREFTALLGSMRNGRVVSRAEAAVAAYREMTVPDRPSTEVQA